MTLLPEITFATIFFVISYCQTKLSPMNRYLLLSLLSFQSFFIYAQKDVPAFGKIEKSDLLLTQCEFDKDAEAYNLLTYGNVNYVFLGENFKIETERRVRIKILKEKGLERANIKIRFIERNKYEDIKNVAGYTYNLDASGNVVKTKLEKSAIYTKKLTKHLSEVSFSMPDVKVGSVIEFKYIDLKNSIANVDDWDFQDDIPTRISVYNIKIPSIFKFRTQLSLRQPIDEKSDEVNENAMYRGKVLSYKSIEKTFTVKNIPSLPDEPFMKASKDYTQRIEFQLSAIDYGNGDITEITTTWDKITKELLTDDDFGVQLNKNLSDTKSLNDSLKNANGEYKKMLMIHNYVRKNMNWNSSESIYSSDGIKSAWDKKSGNNTELNLILINLLRNAGLKAYPVLVSTRDNGTVNTLTPFLRQFNSTITLVLIDNKRYILNAADKYNPAHLIPYDVLNNDGFVVDNRYGGWIKLENEKAIWANTVSIFAEVTPGAVMEGKAKVISEGYCKNPRVKKWEEEKKSFKDYFSKEYTGIKIDEIEAINTDIDTLPLQQNVTFSLPVNSSGDYQYFTLNLFLGLEKNPFIADERRTDVDFNFRQSYTLVGKFFIPDNYEFDDLPKNMRMSMPDSSIELTRMLQKDASAIDVRVTLKFNRSYYAAEDYDLLQEFYKKLFTTLNEQIVIKKKS